MSLCSIGIYYTITYITYAVTTECLFTLCCRFSAKYYNCGSAYNSYSDSYFAYKEIIDIYYWKLFLLWDELLEVTFVLAGAFFFNGGFNLRLAEKEQAVAILLWVLRVILAPCVFQRIAACVALIVLVDNLREISRDAVEELVSDVGKHTVLIS